MNVPLAWSAPLDVGRLGILLRSRCRNDDLRAEFANIASRTSLSIECRYADETNPYDIQMRCLRTSQPLYAGFYDLARSLLTN